MCGVGEHRERVGARPGGGGEVGAVIPNRDPVSARKAIMRRMGRLWDVIPGFHAVRVKWQIPERVSLPNARDILQIEDVSDSCAFGPWLRYLVQEDLVWIREF